MYEIYILEKREGFDEARKYLERLEVVYQ